MSSLKYRTIGSGEAIVTALHPLTLNGGWYEPLATFASKEFTWLIPDMPGHGATPYGDTPVTLDSMGDDVVALWDELGIERSAIVGVSLGGMVAQSVTHRARDRVWAQVLMGTTHSYPEAIIPATHERIATTRATTDIDVLVASTVARWFSPEQIAANDPLVVQARADVRGCDIQVHADFLAAMVDVGYVGTSPAWSPPPPTLVVGGRDDRSTPLPVVEALAAAIGSDLALLDGGHLAAFEYPEETARFMSAFLSKYAPVSAR